jgi:hypothetical protein
MRTAAVALGCVFAVGGAVWGQDAPLKVEEATAKQAALVKVVPEYPTIARQLKLGGQVGVEALIDLEGKVEKAQIVRGNPVLGNRGGGCHEEVEVHPVCGERQDHARGDHD